MDSCSFYWFLLICYFFYVIMTSIAHLSLEEEGSLPTVFTSGSEVEEQKVSYLYSLLSPVRQFVFVISGYTNRVWFDLIEALISNKSYFMSIIWFVCISMHELNSHVFIHLYCSALFFFKCPLMIVKYSLNIIYHSCKGWHWNGSLINVWFEKINSIS